MPKKIWLSLAWIWTITIAILCLVSFKKLPGVKLPGADKYVHGFLHFVFVMLWCGYYRSRHLSGLSRFLRILSLSVVYGCLIEIGQHYLTTTRQADIKDVAANFAGAALAVLLQTAIARKQKRNLQ